MSAPTSDTAAIRQVIRTLKAAGYALDRVHDGEDDITVRTEPDAIAAITAVDDAWLHVTHPSERPSAVWFVLGNDPEEVIANYGESLSPVLDPLIERWS